MATVTVDPADLVTVGDIAYKTQINRSTVSMWIRRRETSGFPAPVIATPTASTRLWSWAAVQQWLRDSE